MNVNPGELNKRITIMQKNGVKDAAGYRDDDPKAVCSCWAKFTRTSGTEAAKSNADFSEIKCRFLIRYTRQKISRDMIVRYSGEDYEIVYINDYGDNNEYIEIWCQQITRMNPSGTV